MKRFLSLVAVLATATATVILGPFAPAANAAGPELIANGSFETPDISGQTFAIFSHGALPGWSSEQVGGSSSGIEIQDHVAGAPAAGAGDQFAELDSDGPTRIFQNVTTVAGHKYNLTFLYSARPSTSGVENHFSVTFGGTTQEIGPLTSGPSTNWQSGSLTFVATESTTLVSFLDLGPEQSSGGVGAFIDAVSVREADADFAVCPLYDQSKAQKSGSTVPIKLQVCDTDGSNLSSPVVMVSASGLTKLDDMSSSSVEDSGAANPDDNFRYDRELGGSGGYIFNLSTTGLTAGTWVLGFTVDGLAHDAYRVQFDVR